MFQNLKKNPPTLTLPLKGGRENLVGRVYQADRKTCCRISKSDLQDTKRIDTTPETNYNSNMMNYKSETLKRVQHDRSGSEAHSKHNPHATNAKRAAFTLAEVLITLAIIGIVAALTIPTLISNYRKNVVVTQLKKVNSTLAQVFMTSQAENGTAGFEPTAQNVNKFYETYWKPYFRVAKECDTYADCGYSKSVPFTRPNGGYDSLLVAGTGRKAFLTNDGILYTVALYTINDADLSINPNSSTIIVDLNGSNGPNRYGQDVFIFNYKYGKSVFPKGFDLTDEEVREDCSMSGRGHTCAEAVKRNNWEIPDWYPIKF